MHGAGNDFVIISKLKNNLQLLTEDIVNLCDRKRGIGADGIIFIHTDPSILQKINKPSSQKSTISSSKNKNSSGIHKPKSSICDYDIIMEYYNKDGSRGEMCGNGLRCAAFYAHHKMSLPSKLKVKTDAGILSAEIIPEVFCSSRVNIAALRQDQVRSSQENDRLKYKSDKQVCIEIPVQNKINKILIDQTDIFYGNTGVPHAVISVDNLKEINVNKIGKFYRTHPFFAPAGTNVNFIQKVKDLYLIRTYERGVELETSACGTGISAAALTLHNFFNIPSPINFLTVDNDLLTVDIPKNPSISRVYLTGPASFVFEGIYKLKTRQ